MRFTQTLALLTAFAVPAVALANPIAISGTGIGSIGSADNNYTLISAPAGAVSGTATISTANPLWFQPGGSLHWINTSGSGNAADPTGVYKYATSFNIGSGFSASTAALRLIVAADDQVNIYLNGNLIISSVNPAFYNTTVYNVASGSGSGIVSGNNVLEFDVDNTGGGPEGLYVEASGTVSPVPEPSSVALLGTGLLAAVGMARKRLLHS